MQSQQPLFLILLSLLLTSLSTTATPVERPSSLGRRIAVELHLTSTLSKRDVVVPKITSPDKNSVWPIGSKQTVTWDTSDFPPYNQITNPIGMVILGWESGDSLNLQLDNPLAKGFNITAGKVDVTVPNVPPRKDYLIVLMGDSGNTSPSFAITSISGGSNSTTTSPTPPSSTSTTTSRAATTTPALPSSTTVTDSNPISGTTTTGGGTNADTTIPTSSNTASLAGNPTPSASTTNQANSGTTPLSAGSISLSSMGTCWNLAIAFLVAAVVML